MAFRNSSVGSSSSGSINRDKAPPSVSQDEISSTPLWNYVTKMAKTNEGGGNSIFVCNFCGGTFKRSYSRVKAHLLKLSGHGIRVCPKVTHEHLAEMNRVVEEAQLKLQPKTVPLPPSSNPQVAHLDGVRSTILQDQTMGSKKRKGGVENSFNLASRENLHSQIARMFHSGGLPFHFARNPYFISAITYAANQPLSGYIPPGYNALRTTLLQRERAHIERLLQPIKGTWKEKGVSIVCDGWTDAQRRPLINFMAASEGGAIFLKAINCEGEYKDKHYVASLIKEAIADVGAQNVVQVITDNAPVCKAAGSLVEAQHTHIFWTPCVVHTLNLALKNICAAKNSHQNEVNYDLLSWITKVGDDAIYIRNFIMNHSMRLAIFNTFVSLKLLAIAETRFASVIIMLKWLKLIKQGLQQMVISEEWSSYREDDVYKAGKVKEIILDDE
ncbi:hypothetical protein COLO4_20882 [Corchorus olitorius]|uniref:DUF659 domain-containing protein n=1 Tax=Corchorus olitorius TaxID=93759 RepID=A0A1R3IWC8_9ROSI|nr:hypothetical protein COLO4_20882 [Corchorus olitorius]